jgi:hypothetical protein
MEFRLALVYQQYPLTQAYVLEFQALPFGMIVALL